MFSRSTRGRLPALVLCAVIALGGSAAAQSTPQTGGTTERKWPSQSLPEQPVNVRICSCLYAGQNIPIGQTICMKFDGKHVRATCDTVVNSPSWTISKVECPSS